MPSTPQATDNMPGMFISALSSPNQMMKGLAMLAKNGCSLLTFPYEMILRPRFGSRYFHLILMCISLPCWQAICLLASIFGGQSYGAIVLVIAIWSGCVYNGFRIWKLMIHPEQEKDSEQEGEPILALSHSWAVQRMVYEPLGILFAAIFFKLIGVFNLILTLCVVASGAALCLKNLITWYEAWTYLRDMLDQQGRIPIIQAIAAGKPVPKSIGRFTLSSIPVGTNPKTQAVIASGLAGLTPEMERLLSSVEH